MKKNGFTLVEIIVCLVLLISIISVFMVFNVKKDDTITLSTIEKNILNAADVLVNINKDATNNNYAEQLNLGAQGVKIKLTRLIEEGLLDEDIINQLLKEQQEKDETITEEEVKNYYILVLNGSLTKEEDGNNCNGFSYYLSWQENINNKNVTLYLCGNNPNKETDKTANVKIEEKNGLDSFIYSYGNEKYKLKDEDENIKSPNSDGTYTLNYAKKYYIEFTEDSKNNANYMDLEKYNNDKNYVYITLENVKHFETGAVDTIYYDLSNYSKIKKPQYKISFLSKKLGTSNRDASTILNYNSTTPYPLEYKSSSTNNNSIYIYKYSNYCYGTSYEYNSITQKYKLKGTIECKKYTEGDSFFINKYTLRSEKKDTEASTMYKLLEENSANYFSGTEYSNTASKFDDGYYYDYDDDGKTYFYRGDIDNNYVSFAGFLWRIIRINGDGTIRLILDGDIGESNWNDKNNFEYYNGYTYGDITYYPLISSYTDSTRERTDYNNSYCYSDTFTYDKSKNKYKLSGNIFCEKITQDTYYTKFMGMYTLKQTSKTATSTTMYKLSSRYSNSENYFYTYNTESTISDKSIHSNKYCYGTDYAIENGNYVLKGTIDCDISLYSSNYSRYKNYYTIEKNTKTATNTKMYKFVNCPNCTSGWSRYDEYIYVKYLEPIPNYTSSSKNSSKIKIKLEDWYNANLSGNDYFISYSRFCNDTSKVTKSSYYSSSSYNSYNRLGSSGSNKTPTFKCNKSTNYGGSYSLKIGLITADELSYAGAVYNSANSNYYLKYNKSYWTMTPYSNNSMFTTNIYENSESYSGSTWYTDSSGYSHIVETPEEWEMCNSGELDCESGGGYYHASVNYNIFSSTNLNSSTSSVYQYDGDASIVIRPVINLNRDVIVYGTGTGTYGNPYVIDTKVEDLYYLYMKEGY